MAVRPAAERSRGKGKLRPERWHQQHHADADQHRPSKGAQVAGVKTDCVTDGGDEELTRRRGRRPGPPHQGDARSPPRRARSGSTAGRTAKALKGYLPAGQSRCCPRSCAASHGFKAVLSNSSIGAAPVSPTKRRVSCAPLKAISVLCCRALKLLTTSFWASKRGEIRAFKD